MIYDRCIRCRNRIPPGTKCSCYKRQYEKKDSKDRYVSFYRSSSWQKIRAVAMARYNNLDVYSLYIHGRIEQADTVHHIDPVKESWDARFNIDNLIPLTNSNHQLIHKAMNNGEEVKDTLHTVKRKYQAQTANESHQGP